MAHCGTVTAVGCLGKLRDGSPCRRPVPDGDWCSSHDPARQAERDAATKKRVAAASVARSAAAAAKSRPKREISTEGDGFVAFQRPASRPGIYVTAADVLSALDAGDYGEATRLMPVWLAGVAMQVESGELTHMAAGALDKLALGMRRAIKVAIDTAANAADEAPMTAAELAELARLEVEEQSGGRIRLQIVNGGRGVAAEDE